MYSSTLLETGRTYTRDDLRALCSITDATLNTGVFWLKEYNSIWIFVTEKKTADRTPYMDRLDGDVLHWDGQTEGRTDDLIIKHAENGLELLVFYRKRKYEYPHAAFRYLGRFRCLSKQGSRPTHFTLQRDDAEPNSYRSNSPVNVAAESLPKAPALTPDARIGVILSHRTRSVSIEGPLTKSLPDVLAGRPEEIPAVIRKARRVVESLPDPFGAPQAGIGLLLGRIQAGKTNGMIATTAVAADNGYKVVIVLTSDNTWLYEQTLERFKATLPRIVCAGYTQWAGKSVQIKAVLGLDAGAVVLVTTKNGTRLRALAQFLSDMNMQEMPALIFDDEADQASLDANASKPGKPPTPINRLISKIRNTFLVSGFVQVTATPQALLLLDKDSEYRPKFTVMLDPGSDYVGADCYFQEASPYLKAVPLDEVSGLKAKEGAGQMPDGLMQALSTFLVAATANLLASKVQPYSFLVHVSLKTEHHNRIARLIQHFVIEVARELGGSSFTHNVTLRDALSRAYQDLLSTCGTLPPLGDIFSHLGGMAQGVDIQVLNSKNEEKQAKYSAPYNILIGGTKLGRGVTIKGLLVTYYGRESKTPQMDTVQQHARMYGYRKTDLPFTRIFLPQELARYFQEINLSENELRAWLETLPNTTFDPQIIPTGMRATRRQVLNPTTVGCYIPGKSYTPTLTSFENFTDLRITQALDRILRIPGAGTYLTQQVGVKDIHDILLLIRTKDRNASGWNDDRIRAALGVLQRLYGDRAHLTVFSHRRLKLRDAANVASSADLTRAPKDLPALFMFRQEGLLEDDWRGVPFWVPVFRFPEGDYPLAFNFS